jgi:hypothetical protein
MPVEVYLTTAEDDAKSLNLDGKEKLVPTLGDEEAFAIKIDEVLESVASIVGANISNEAEIIIELSGTTSIKTNGKISYLVLNIGGSVSKDNSMKITLKTKIDPKK